MRVERVHIMVFLAIAALVWYVTLFLQDTLVTWEHGKPFTVVVTFLVMFGVVFDRFLWRWPLLHGWFVKRPDLRGTWLVELQASSIDSDARERISRIVCYMEIEQTLSKLKMHLMTPESESWAIASQIRPSPNGNGYQVIGVYTNDPDIHLRDKQISQTHKGAFIISTHGSDVRPNTLKAEYWTDRKTVGTMDFKSRVDKVFTRFDDAKRYFEQG